MEYKVLYINENGTAKVQMVINGHTLEQDFLIGEVPEDLDSAVKQGMAVFKKELETNQVAPTYTPSLDTQRTVDMLPEIAAADNQPEPSVESTGALGVD